MRLANMLPALIYVWLSICGSALAQPRLLEQSPAAKLSFAWEKCSRAFYLLTRPSLCGKTILLDAGHGGRDAGASRLGIREKDITLRLVLQLKATLELRGAKVLLTRFDDTDLELEDICQIVDRVKPDIFVSVHVNSSPGDTSVSGLQTYFRTAHSRMLAHTVQATTLRSTGSDNRGIFCGRLWVLRSSTVPSILIESGYVNCRTDRKRLLDSRYRQKIADGIADGVTSYWMKKGLLH